MGLAKSSKFEPSTRVEHFQRLIGQNKRQFTGLYNGKISAETSQM